jgi:hypothetical protein
MAANPRSLFDEGAADEGGGAEGRSDTVDGSLWRSSFIGTCPRSSMVTILSSFGLNCE